MCYGGDFFGVGVEFCYLVVIVEKKLCYGFIG